MFNCLQAIWPKGYQCGSLGKRHQNGDYLKQVSQLSYHRTSKLLVLISQNYACEVTSSFAEVVEQ